MKLRYKFFLPQKTQPERFHADQHPVSYLDSTNPGTALRATDHANTRFRLADSRDLLKPFGPFEPGGRQDPWEGEIGQCHTAFEPPTG